MLIKQRTMNGRKGARGGAGRIDKIYLRGDSALYEHERMREFDEHAIGQAVSAETSPQLAEYIAALSEDHWKAGQAETRRRCTVQLEVRRQRRPSAPQRDPLPPAVRIQARRLTLGNCRPHGPSGCASYSQHGRKVYSHARVTLPRTCSPSNAPPLPGFEGPAAISSAQTASLKASPFCHCG
jgi:hypothetical protein